MSKQLETELRTYMSYLDTQVAPIAVDDIVRSSRQVAPTPRRTRRGLVAALSAALVTLLLVGGIALLVPLDGSSSPADEPAVTTTLGSEPAPTSGTVTMTWVNAKWVQGQQGPFVRSIVSTPSGFLGTDLNGSLWRSMDGASWEPILTELDGVTIASSGSVSLVSGLRDGNTVLLRSIDGIDWTEIDRSVVPLDRDREVMATTPSGLTWFGPNARDGSGAGVLAVVSGDRITEVHNPPWDPEVCCGITDLVEVGGNIAAYQPRSKPGLSLAWEYLGNGEWSDVMDVTFNLDHPAVVGDTVLMFDQTNATCCGNPIPGTSFWPLLSSSDGIHWTEVAQIPGDDVHTLHVNAGSSFWIYGPSIGGGGGDIEVNPDTTLGVSRDGLTWQRIDLSQVDVSFFAEPLTGFVHVAGDIIFLSNGTSFEGTGEYWIGTIDAQ